MKKDKYKQIERYMLSCMQDSAHDKEHIYRVLYIALDIAQYEQHVDMDVLITACLLHDIGRHEQFENPKVCHAIAGAQKAYDFLKRHGFSEIFANAVKGCIETHRFRTDRPPVTIAAKILFDADKIDATGTLGIARTIFFQGQMSQPLYSVLPDGGVSDGANDSAPSFFREYRFKLEKLYDKFYTARGVQIAKLRQHSAEHFYNNMLSEVESSYAAGMDILDRTLDE